MAYETIEFKLEGGVARLTLNRPDRLNSFTVKMHEEVADALGRLGGARTLVLTGAGRGFCAGADMQLLSGIVDAGVTARVEEPRPDGDARIPDHDRPYRDPAAAVRRTA